MNQNRTIPGGEAATHQLKNDNFTRLFKPGVRFLRMKKANIYFVKVLPAFNPAIAKTDPAYKLGTVPYRNSEGQLNSFIYKVMVCRGIGTQSMDFFSPKTFGPGEMDLIEQLFVTAKSIPAYEHFTKFATSKPSILSGPAEVGLMNVVQPYKPDDGVRILMMPNSGTKDFVTKINLTRDANQLQVQAPFGDKFQWGDITDVTHGLVMSIKAGQNPQSGFTQYECDFQQIPGPQGAGTRMLYPCTSQEMYNSMLGARYDIPDVLNIMSQGEILEYLNSSFPRPLIEAAFASMFSLPPAPAHAVFVTPPTAGWTPGAQPAPVAPAAPAFAVPPPTWTAPAPAAPVAPVAPPQTWTAPATAAPVAPPPAWTAPATAAPVAPPPAWTAPAAPAAPPQAWTAPGAPVAPPPAWTAPAAPMAPAATLPSPGAMPMNPPPPAVMTTLPGADEIRQDPATNLWEGLATRELAVEYRQLSALFNSNPEAARDQSNLQRMMQLIQLKK